MASDLDYVQYVIDQIKTNGKITYKKMFGEYLLYLNNKPVVMVCDNTAFVKMLDCIKPLMKNAEIGFPYKGAKEHYIANVDDSEHLSNVVILLEKNLPITKKKNGNDLLNNIEKIHTTELGTMRIRKNLELEIKDVVKWCKQKVKQANDIHKEGKNWYISFEDYIITINSYSYTIITAHKK